MLLNLLSTANSSHPMKVYLSSGGRPPTLRHRRPKRPGWRRARFVACPLSRSTLNPKHPADLPAAQLCSRWNVAVRWRDETSSLDSTQRCIPVWWDPGITNDKRGATSFGKHRVQVHCQKNVKKLLSPPSTVCFIQKRVKLFQRIEDEIAANLFAQRENAQQKVRR